MKKRTLIGGLVILGFIAQATRVEVAYSPESLENSRIVMQGSCELDGENCGSIELDPHTRLTVELTKAEADLCRLECQLEVDGDVKMSPVFVTEKNQPATIKFGRHDESASYDEILMVTVSE